MGDQFDSQEFYELMQEYRHACVSRQSAIFDAFEAVKEFARSTPKQGEMAQPKALDDPRLQDLFSCAIDGALTSGYQGVAPAPAGHWLEAWWRRGRAVKEVESALPFEFETGLVQLLNEARCLSEKTVGNRELAGRIARYVQERAAPKEPKP